ncbi:MAG: DNA-directed RNA polymerase subunit alpha C-terminal domain-containing protein [Chitinophagaceae bacterium]
MNNMAGKVLIKNRRVCNAGHEYYKSSSCPVCLVCEKNRQPGFEFPSSLSAPARRALENAGIVSLLQLSKMSEADILKLHGMGPGSIPKLRDALKEKGLTFRGDKK